MSQDSSSTDCSAIPETDFIESVETIQRGKRTPLFLFVGAVLLAGGVAARVYSASIDEPTPVEVAHDDATDLDAEGGEADESSARDNSSEPAVGERAMDMAAGAMVGDVPGSVLFHDGRFVALGYGPNGQTIRTSDDGLSWSESRISGLGRNSHIYHLTAQHGVYAALVEQWNEEGEGFFGSSNGPDISIAYTTDLESWTIKRIAKSTDDGVHTGGAGLALIDSDVVVVTQQYPVGPDEMRLLFQAGYLNEQNVDRYCGLRFTDDDIIQVQECNYEEFEEPDERLYVELEEKWNAATTDEERAAIEAELEGLWGGPEGEVVAEIQPGSTIHSELSSLYHGDRDDDFRPTTTVLTGPLDGELVATTLPTDGYVNSIVRSGDRLFMLITDGENGTARMLASSNGRQWDEMTAPAGTVFEGTLSAGGESLLFTAYEGEQGPGLNQSPDGGRSWTKSILPSDLYGAHPTIVSGPAGYVAVVTGTDEPFEYREPESMRVTKDGFTLTTTWDRDNGEGESITLTGPDGNLIYKLSGEEMYGDDSEYVRTSPFSGTPTFLDPETGEDLVSFTHEDYESSYREREEAFSEVEPTYLTEHYFSSDGVSWTLIDDDRLAVDSRSAHTSPVAVGDDEAIFAKHTWVEPDPALFAFEEEGRDPTEEEMRALEMWELSAAEGSVEYIRIEFSS